MKNLVLLALCWAMAMSQPFAQKNLPPSAAANIANLSENLKKMLETAGFELPNTVGQMGGKQYTGDRSSALVLDSTLNFYDYGLNGNDSLPLFKSRFSYPNEDTKLEVQGQHENGAWQFTNRITSIYDEQERLVDLFAQIYDPSVPTWVGDSRLEIFPHGNSPDLFDSSIVSGWNVDLNDWVRLMTIVNFFDNEGRIYEQHTEIAAFGEPLLFKDIYTYDTEGDNTLIESYYVEPGFELLANIIEMKYLNHLVTSEVEIVYDGVDFIPQTRVATDYNDVSLPANVENYEWSVADTNWVNTQSSLFEYDDQQRLTVLETAKHYEGVEDERYRFEYVYIEGELLQLEASYFWGQQENMFILDGKKYYYYSGDVSPAPDRPQDVVALNIYPNPTTGMARMELESEVAVQVFDAAGQLVASQMEDNGRIQLDISTLPAGIYMVQAVSEDKLYSGRLVKQ